MNTINGLMLATCLLLMSYNAVADAVAAKAGVALIEKLPSLEVARKLLLDPQATPETVALF